MKIAIVYILCIYIILSIMYYMLYNNDIFFLSKIKHLNCGINASFTRPLTKIIAPLLYYKSTLITSRKLQMYRKNNKINKKTSGMFLITVCVGGAYMMVNYN